MYSWGGGSEKFFLLWHVPPLFTLMPAGEEFEEARGKKNAEPKKRSPPFHLAKCRPVLRMSGIFAGIPPEFLLVRRGA